MGYYTKHLIKIVNKNKQKLSDYARLVENMASVSGEWDEYEFPFIIENKILSDRNWNYGSGRDWPTFKEDVIGASKKLPKLEIECAFIGEERGDNGFMVIQNGKVVDEHKLTKEEEETFKLHYLSYKFPRKTTL